MIPDRPPNRRSTYKVYGAAKMVASRGTCQPGAQLGHKVSEWRQDSDVHDWAKWACGAEPGRLAERSRTCGDGSGTCSGMPREARQLVPLANNAEEGKYNKAKDMSILKCIPVPFRLTPAFVRLAHRGFFDSCGSKTRRETLASGIQYHICCIHRQGSSPREAGSHCISRHQCL
jgi:hypothetical protein